MDKLISKEELKRIQRMCESIEECNNTLPKTDLCVPLITEEVRLLTSTIEQLQKEVERYKSVLQLAMSQNQSPEVYSEIKSILGESHDPM